MKHHFELQVLFSFSFCLSAWLMIMMMMHLLSLSSTMKTKKLLFGSFFPQLFSSEKFAKLHPPHFFMI